MSFEILNLLLVHAIQRVLTLGIYRKLKLQSILEKMTGIWESYFLFQWKYLLPRSKNFPQNVKGLKKIKAMKVLLFSVRHPSGCWFRKIFEPLPSQLQGRFSSHSAKKSSEELSVASSQFVSFSAKEVISYDIFILFLRI